MTTLRRSEEDGSYNTDLSIDAGTYDRPYTSLIFIAVGWNGSDFMFLNNLSLRMEFKTERWSKFKKHLRPMTFHCFKVEGYRTNSGSGSGFRPVEHIAEFPGIDVARFFNKAYLKVWQTFHDDEPDDVSKQTELFVEQLYKFSDSTFNPLIEVLSETIEDVFQSEVSQADFEWVMSLQGLPFEQIEIDGVLPIWMNGYEQWCKELEQ